MIFYSYGLRVNLPTPIAEVNPLPGLLSDPGPQATLPDTNGFTRAR